MNRSRTSIQFAVLAFLLFPAAAGILAVHASATCERFVRTYVTTPVRNRVSKQTAEAWAAWRVGHPNWKPNPNIRRPKYVMTREEALQKVSFVCSVPTVPVYLDIVFTPADLEAPPPVVADLPPVAELPPVETTPVLLPPEVPSQAVVITPQLPIVPPRFASPPGLVPEPGTWLLVATGLAFLSVTKGAKSLRTKA